MSPATHQNSTSSHQNSPPVSNMTSSLSESLSKYWQGVSQSAKRSTRTTLLFDLFALAFAAHAVLVYLVCADRAIFFYPLMLSIVVYSSRQYSVESNSKSPEANFFELC